MKNYNESIIKKQLIKIIKSANVEEIIYEPRYFESPVLPTIDHKSKDRIGSIITIKTLNKRSTAK